MTAAIVEKIFQDMAVTLARRFPIACASDEFYYFPQTRPTPPDWTIWDDFSKDTVADTVQLLADWERALNRQLPVVADSALKIDIRLLIRVARTLRSQLERFRTWQCQPTFHLSIACVGMAEAVGDTDDGAKHARGRGLATFLDRAAANLGPVPTLFRELALEMIPDTRRYLAAMRQRVPEMGPALTALDRFEDTVRHTGGPDTFHLSGEKVDLLVDQHLNTGMQQAETMALLDEEIARMRQVLESTALQLSADRSWQQAVSNLPLPAIGHDGLIGFYRDQVQLLADSCIETGLVDAALAAQCPVTVAAVPDFLAATRTASSYSIAPVHPPSGGTFFIYNANDPEEAHRPYQREYRILCAHETWPGHHLLDVMRWRHERPLRRVIEHPLFYEGWACFAEELMRQVGYFDTAGDQLQLARRRLWRAVRGKIDLGLQTGAMDLKTAADTLSRTGMAMARARAVVRKYALNPGYQLCYAIGLHQFINLYAKYGQGQPARFAKHVLAQGEIGFADLEVALQQTRSGQPTDKGDAY